MKCCHEKQTHALSGGGTEARSQGHGGPKLHPIAAEQLRALVKYEAKAHGAGVGTGTDSGTDRQQTAAHAQSSPTGIIGRREDPDPHGPPTDEDEDIEPEDPRMDQMDHDEKHSPPAQLPIRNLLGIVELIRNREQRGHREVAVQERETGTSGSHQQTSAKPTRTTSVL